jgi:uncharacterized membrane protein YjfL (UPF0719 family)
MQLALIGVIQFAVSILLAAIAAYLGIWLFERATRNIDEWQELQKGNRAIGITLAAVVIGLAIVLQPAVAGALPATSGRLFPDIAPRLFPVIVLLLMVTRVLLGLILGSAAILFAMWLFLRLTRDLDEMAELGKGNVAVAATLAGVILATSWLISPVVAGITNWLLPLFLP